MTYLLVHIILALRGRQGISAFDAILVYIEKAIQGYPISKWGKKLRPTKPHSSKNNVSKKK